MMGSLSRILHCAFAAAVLLMVTVPAQAQSWPSKPVRWIIPFPPGGPADVIARMVAPRLSDRLGQPVLVENRPGAASNIGYEAAARAAPDGYTMVLGVAGLVTNPHLYKLNFDPLKDLTPVTPLVTIQIVLVANPNFPPTTLGEILALARSKPGTVRCAWGASTVLQLACETIRLEGNVDIVIVAYKGLAPALNDLLGGHVDLMFDVTNTALPQVTSGKLKAIATTNPARGMHPFPALPTANEVIPGFEMATWQGIFMPAGTPVEIIERMNREVASVLAEPEIKQRINESGLQTMTRSPKEFDEIVRSDYERYGRLIRAAGIKAN